MTAKLFHELSAEVNSLTPGNSLTLNVDNRAALFSEETKYRILVEHIPAITYIAAINEQSSTLYTSPQIEGILGFSQSEWMANHTLWLKQIHREDRTFVQAELARIHSGHDPKPCEYRMITRDGQIRWFVDDSAVVRDIDGHPLALYGVMIDITKHKNLENRIAEIQRQLEESRRPHLQEHELAVLRLIGDLRTDAEISKTLAVSERTVRNYIKTICAKFGVARRADAVRQAIQWGVLER